MNLFEFAFCSDYEEKISSLAAICPEKWSFGNNTDNQILKNYIAHTFSKQYEDGNVAKDTEANYALFNTGLFTKHYEPIYAYFLPNKIPEKQDWYFMGFFTSYQLGMCGVTLFPPRANYFSNPADLVFDTNCTIIPQYDHIFDDPENLSRIPELIRNNPMKSLLFDGALERAKRMIDANYKTAIPQYYKGKIQLLIPICLINQNVPDLALVVSKYDTGHYLGRTCLTLEMAYNNARLIARPDSLWLTP